MNYVNNTYQYGPTKVRTIVDLDDPKEFFICASDLEKVSPIYTVHSYLERDDTKALMEVIPKSGCKNQPVDGGRLIKTVAEGTNRGTWFCRALALDFCRWISPKLFVWCESVCNRIASTSATTDKDSLYSTTEVIKFLEGDWNVKTLLSDLEEKGVIKFSQANSRDKKWTMCDRSKLRFIKEKTFTIKETNFTKQYNVWTEEGKNYLINLYNK